MKEKLCFRCKTKAFRRINREGFLQTVIFPYFGYYPWECIMCRRRFFFRDDGRRLRHSHAE